MSPFTTLSSKITWSCPWYNVRQDQIILPNGQPGIFNIVQKAPAEVIQVHRKPISEVVQMTQDNAIKDAPSAYVILLCATQLLEMNPEDNKGQLGGIV